MKERLRWFLAVAVVSTIIDVGGFVVLAGPAGVHALLADTAALVVAAVTSWTLNRWVAFGGDPHARWVKRPFAFFATATVAAVVDLGVLAAVHDPGDNLLVSKLVALVAAGVVRYAAYRIVVFNQIQRDLNTRTPRPVPDGELRLTVIVPAFNESARIASTIDDIRAALDGPLGGSLEILVVDDGSTDDTSGRAADADQVIALDRNRGKGGAVRAGVGSARGRAIAFTDADLSYDPSHLLELVVEIEAGWDMAVGSRRHTDTTTLVRARRVREMGGRLINLVTYAVLLGAHRDTQCGLKAFRSDVGRLLFRKGRLDGFAFDVELFLLVERYRLSVTELPVQVANRGTSSVRIVRHTLDLLADLARLRWWTGQGVYDLGPSELPVAPTVPS
ncbi:MAG: glycosyltransferase [Actinomycetia bacterium]|nr:glycosyltransferase [Actinomycetes bacterium]